MGTTIVIVLIGFLTLVVALIAISRFPRDTELVLIRNVLWNRYLNQPFPTYDPTTASSRQEVDRLIGYLERVVDRQINKARGILPFNSIIIAAFSFERTHLPPALTISHLDINALLLATMALLVISSALCLILFLVRWGTSADYEFEAEVRNTVGLVRGRSKVLEFATVLSFIALVGGAALIAAVELVPKT